MMGAQNVRLAAVNALLAIQQEGGYSNIVLDELLRRQTLSSNDRAYVTRLVYGVTERRLTIDYCLNKLSTVPVIKMDATVREVLRIGVYQLLFMDNTPDFAAIHESVELIRAKRKSRLSGYVNGVLRSAQREGRVLLDALPHTDKGEEIRTSCPRGWIRYWRQAYGDEITRGILSAINEAPPTYIRVNTLRTTTDALVRALSDYGCVCRPVEGLADALEISQCPALNDLPRELREQFYFQDIASQWCCAALDAQPGDRVADVCAAPGGKSFTIAQYMRGEGYIEAADIYERKRDILANRARELGISCVRAVCRDATQAPAADQLGQFDRVLCDVPCSGLGVIRRKPEIRYKDPEGFDDLPAIQSTILSQAAKLVRPGGVLQYSTCTLRPEENEAVAEAFLQTHPHFIPRVLPIIPCFSLSGTVPGYSITLFPHLHNSDGFFISGFIRMD